MNPSLPGTGRPGQGTLVLQHAPPPPGPQPVSRTLPETGTMTTRHRARQARCQPRHEPGTLMATVTPSTSTPRRRTPWTPPDDATPAPQGHPQRRGTAGNLIAERQHQRRPRQILQIRQAHIGNARAQQRYPRNAALTGPLELKMSDRQALRIVLWGLEPVSVPQDQHVQVTRGDIIQAAVPHGVTVGQVTIDRLMPRQPQPVQHRPPFPLQIGDRGRHIDLSQLPPLSRPRSVTQPSHAAARPATQTGQRILGS